jgi:hypothetical protein
MKLRLKGNSIRLRVTRSELARLQAGERIQEIVHFPAGSTPTFAYALEIGAHSLPATVTFIDQQVVVSLSQAQLASWSDESQVGVYASLPVDATTVLEIAVEKDFACLDLSDADNIDTFTNPLAGNAC